MKTNQIMIQLHDAKTILDKMRAEYEAKLSFEVAVKQAVEEEVQKLRLEAYDLEQRYKNESQLRTELEHDHDALERESQYLRAELIRARCDTDDKHSINAAKDGSHSPGLEKSKTSPERGRTRSPSKLDDLGSSQLQSSSSKSLGDITGFVRKNSGQKSTSLRSPTPDQTTRLDTQYGSSSAIDKHSRQNTNGSTSTINFSIKTKLSSLLGGLGSPTKTAASPLKPVDFDEMVANMDVQIGNYFK